MSKLDSLVVDLQLNSAALRSGLDSAQTALAGFGKSIEHIDHQLHALTEAKSFEIGKELVKGLAEFVQKGAEAAEKMGLLAQAAGVPVEAFSRLDYAASLSGVATEDLSKSFTKLNKNAALAGAGVPAQAAIFEALGIKVKDASGHVKTAADLMPELADKFAGLKDGASKSALAMEIFGKAGAQMVPMLNEGREGLEKYGAELETFGGVITPAAAASAKAFEDNLIRLKKATQSVAIAAAGDVAPALTRLTDELLSSKTGALDMKGASEGLAVVMKVLASAGVIVGAIFEGVGATIGIAAAAINEAAHGNFKAALTAHDQYTAALEESGKAARARLDAIWAAPTPGGDAGMLFLKGAAGAGKGSADPIMSKLEGLKKSAPEADTALKSLTATLHEWELKVAEAGVGESWLDQLEAKLSTGKIADELTKAGAKAAGLRDRLLEVGTALHDAEALKLSLKVDFEIARSAATIGRSAADRRESFAGASAGGFDPSQLTAGFTNFDNALAMWTRDMDQNARKLGEAQMLEKDGDLKGAQNALLFADAAAAAAGKASRAMDVFQASAVKSAAVASVALGALVSKLGGVGQVISAAAQGMATAGPWGAIIAVLAEVLSRMQSFTKLTDYLNKDLETHLGVLSKILAPLFEMLQGMGEAMNSLLDSFSPLQWAFTAISAILWAVGKTMILMEIATVGVIIWFNELTQQNTSQLKLQMEGLVTKLKEGFVDPMQKTGDAAAKTAAALNQMTVNLPSGYKLAGAQFGADGSSSGVGTSGGGVGTTKTADYSASSRPTGTGASALTLTPEEAALWTRIYNAAIITGMSVAGAAAAADAYLKSNRNGSQGAGWGSGSAPAAGGAHPPSGTAYGPAPAPIYYVTVQAANLGDLSRQLTEVGKRKQAQKSRNSEGK